MDYRPGAGNEAAFEAASARGPCGRIDGREEGFWSGDRLMADGSSGTSLRFDLHGCELHRYTSSEAKRCLAGKHLVLVGDSLMRYQYLSLVHLLHKGNYPDPGLPLRQFRKGDEFPNVCQEKDYEDLHGWLDRANLSRLSGWPAFMIHTSQYFDGHERCDCFRSTIEDTVENRYFKDPSSGIALSYFTKTYLPMHGHWPKPRGSPPPGVLTPEAYQDIGRANVTWNASNADFVNTILPLVEEVQGPVHAVLWNQGLWSEPTVEEMRDMARSTRDFFLNRSAQFYWKTTTRAGAQTLEELDGFRSLQGSYAKSLDGMGWRLLDAARTTRDLTAIVEESISPSLWEHLLSSGPVATLNRSMKLEVRAVHWDLVHYRPWVYAELNNVWLNMLCNE